MEWLSNYVITCVCAKILAVFNLAISPNRQIKCIANISAFTVYIYMHPTLIPFSHGHCEPV